MYFIERNTLFSNDPPFAFSVSRLNRLILTQKNGFYRNMLTHYVRINITTIEEKMS